MDASRSIAGYRPPMRKPADITIPPNNMTHCQIATPTPSQNNGISAYQTSSTPAIVQRLAKLHDIMAPRPPDASNIQVVAVDGLNPYTVEVLLKILSLYIQNQSSEITVEVCLKMPSGKLLSSERSRDHWNSLCNSFIKDTSHHNQRHIIIVGFAPLMALQIASASWPANDIYTEQLNWESQASKWKDSVRPDMTIIVQEREEFLKWPTVVPVFESNTLIVPQVDRHDLFCWLQIDSLQSFVKHWLNLDQACGCFQKWIFRKCEREMEVPCT